MSFRSILKLTFGLLILAGVMFLLIVQVEKQVGEVGAEKARLINTSYSVGADHTAVIVRQFVEEGDTITVGQTLFELKSSALSEALAEKRLAPEELLYPLNQQGNIVITASKAGVVSKVLYHEGSFVPANSEIAIIIDENALKAEATFNLTPKDFAKISKDTELVIMLPNGQETRATVGSIDVLNREGVHETVILANIGKISNNGFYLTSGTPVNARLVLQQPRLYNQMVGYVRKYL